MVDAADEIKFSPCQPLRAHNVGCVCASGSGCHDSPKTMKVMNCCILKFTPPFDVPPSSRSRTVTRADPIAPPGDAGVNVSVPAGLIAGCTENKAGVSFMTSKFKD